MRVGRLHLNATGSFAVLLFATLAGCTAEGGGTVALKDPNAAIDFDDPNAIPIVGQVVNDEYVPQPGIELTLTPTDAVTSSEDNGAFRFGVRAPGLYTISVLQPGFDSTSLEVNVDEQGLSDVVLVLTPNADGIPYHETETRASYTLCTAGTGGGCGVPVNTYTSFEYLSVDHADFAYYIPNRGLKQMLVEGEWDETTTSGTTRVFTRNPEGLFLGCNNTQAAERPGGAPTQMFFQTTHNETPIRTWVSADSWNTEVGGCAWFVGEQGTKYWFGVRPNPGRIVDGQPVNYPFDMDRRVDIYLTYWYWAKGDQAFTALETE